MTKIKILKDRQILKNLKIEKDKLYEILDVVQNTYKIKVPMKRNGFFKQALVTEDEGILVD